MVRISGGQFLGAQAALQFTCIKRAVVVAFEPVKYRGTSCLRFIEIDGAIMVRIEEPAGR